VRLPVNGLLDTDNAPDQKREMALAWKESNAPAFCIWMLSGLHTSKHLLQKQLKLRLGRLYLL
jgi:hypothetical protein